jgi:ATPase subunit of ABC transporter with duplicated ATPase domains
MSSISAGSSSSSSGSQWRRYSVIAGTLVALTSIVVMAARQQRRRQKKRVQLQPQSQSQPQSQLLRQNEKKDEKEKAIVKVTNNGVRVVIIMGVSGCGKTTVGKTVTSKWQQQLDNDATTGATKKLTKITFYDGDDYHPESNRTKMANSIPLTVCIHHMILAALQCVDERYGGNRMMIDGHGYNNCVILFNVQLIQVKVL